MTVFSVFFEIFLDNNSSSMQSSSSHHDRQHAFIVEEDEENLRFQRQNQEKKTAIQSKGNLLLRT